MKNILITAAQTPDIDGVACAIAYQAFLQQTNPSINYTAAFQNGVHIEAQFALDRLGIVACEINASTVYDNFILVDMCERGGMPEVMDLDKVIEIIDHRMFPDYSAFPNAQFRVEPVGAAATQIAEFFYFNQTIHLSPKIAQLLLCAIYSNTVAFKADVTTFRDVRMKDRLETIVEKPDFFKEVFAYKTQYIQDHMHEVLLSDAKDIPGQNISIFQIELYGAETILNRNDEIIDLLQKLSAHATYCILIIQDIASGKTSIMSRDIGTHQYIENIGLPGSGSGTIRHIDKIMMRKSIIPYFKK